MHRQFHVFWLTLTLTLTAAAFNAYEGTLIEANWDACRRITITFDVKIEPVSFGSILDEGMATDVEYVKLIKILYVV